jgi:hypothetical protein
VAKAAAAPFFVIPKPDRRPFLPREAAPSLSTYRLFFYQSTTGWVGAESAGTTRLAYRVLGWSRIRGHDKVGVSGGGVIVNRREMDRPPADLCRRALAFRPTWRVGEGSSRLNRATLQPTILYTYAPSISSIQNSTVHAATASVLPTALL